eukprot:15479607-Alexandrium_andersonii.AAC.1
MGARGARCARAFVHTWWHKCNNRSESSTHMGRQQAHMCTSTAIHRHTGTPTQANRHTSSQPYKHTSTQAQTTKYTGTQAHIHKHKYTHMHLARVIISSHLGFPAESWHFEVVPTPGTTLGEMGRGSQVQEKKEKKQKKEKMQKPEAEKS